MPNSQTPRSEIVIADLSLGLMVGVAAMVAVAILALTATSADGRTDAPLRIEALPVASSE
ncbi:MAG: hypothetical protein AAF390_17570 [Pseudomonadota bacterium]